MRALLCLFSSPLMAIAAALHAGLSLPATIGAALAGYAVSYAAWCVVDRRRWPAVQRAARRRAWAGDGVAFARGSVGDRLVQLVLQGLITVAVAAVGVLLTR